ncbi:MAG: hypothetical protein K9I94_02105 [Bacteroidales bacterium]|nr:hypothetical protein [Bacteroidales bacterium]
MRKLTLIFTALLLMTAACEKSESTHRLSDLSIPECTGFHFRDHQGAIVATLGKPNVKLTAERESFENPYRIESYPNPAYSVLAVYSTSKISNQPRKMWLVEATTKEDVHYQGYTFSGSQNLIAGGAPIMEWETTKDGSTHIIIDNLPNGVYRLYVQFDDVLLWDNIIIDKGYDPNYGKK